MDYNFKKTIISDAVENKLLIKKLPDWMQKSVQIQKFFDDAIQPLFNSTQQKIVDGYIGDRGTPAALGKVFIEENSTERTEYQLSPVYCAKNDNNELLSVQFYPDLIKNLQHNGSITHNQNRLLSGTYYSWDPPINKNKMINYSNYFWDTKNKCGITTPDYVVMQRGADNGNLWSVQNFWYTIGDRLAEGETATNETFGDRNRFKQAQAPIIEFYKNIEIMNSGIKLRTTVDYMEDTYIPEDFMLKRVGDGAKADSINIKHGDRILFTSIGNPGENNRIYRVNGSTMADGSVQLGLILDENEITPYRITGEPIEGDVIVINYGKTNGATTVYWDGVSWRQTATKNGINTAPPFVLYDLDGVRLDDATKYPGSNFAGNSIFYFKIDYDYDYDPNYTNKVAKNNNQYPIFENSISTEVYQYLVNGEYVDIDSIYQYNISRDISITAEEEIYYRAYSPNHDKGLVLYGTTPSSIGKNFTVKVSNSNYIKNLYPNGTKNDNYMSYSQSGIWRYHIKDNKLKIGTEVQTEYTEYEVKVTANIGGEIISNTGKLFKVLLPKVVVAPQPIEAVSMYDWNQIYIPEYDINDYTPMSEYVRWWRGTGSPKATYTIYMDLFPVNGLNQRTVNESYVIGDITVDELGNWTFDPTNVMITDPKNDRYTCIEYLAFYFYRCNLRFVHSSGVSSTKRIYCVYPDFTSTSLSSTIPDGLVKQLKLDSFPDIGNKTTIVYDIVNDTSYVGLDIGKPTVGWSKIEYAKYNNGVLLNSYCTLTAELDGPTTAVYKTTGIIYDRAFTIPNTYGPINVIKTFTFNAPDDNVTLVVTANNYNEVDYGAGVNSHYAGISIESPKISTDKNTSMYLNSTKIPYTRVDIAGALPVDDGTGAYTLSWIEPELTTRPYDTSMYVFLANISDGTPYPASNVSSTVVSSANKPVAVYNGIEYLNARWFGDGLGDSILPYTDLNTDGKLFKRLHGTISLTKSITDTSKNLNIYGVHRRLYGTRTYTSGFSDAIGLTVIKENLGTMIITEYDYKKSVSRGGDFSLFLNQTTGKVSAIGANSYGALNVSGWNDIVDISAGNEHAVGLKSNGTVVAVGRSSDSNGSWSNLLVTGWSGITSIAAGANHTIARRSNGRVYSTGPASAWSSYLSTSSWSNISKVYAGNNCSFGLTTRGSVVTAQAYNIFGTVSYWSNITKVATLSNCEVSKCYVLGLRSNGTVASSGDRSVFPWDGTSPLDVAGWTGIIDIACTRDASFGLKSDGTVVLAGNSQYFTKYHTWTGIKAIFGNNYGLIGIKADGTMVSDGLDSNTDLTVSGIDLIP